MNPPCIYTVTSAKGGVGKSTIAFELAYLLDAVLVDFDWDAGGVTVAWGYDAELRRTDKLMDALDNNRTPRLMRGHRKPDLVPGSPYLADAGLSAEEFGQRVSAWASDWGRPVVVDTHPGASPSANGPMSESRLIIVPTTIGTKELNATEKMIRDLADYPIALVPNRVPRIPPQAEINRIERIVDGTPVQVAPFIPEGGRAVQTRKKRMAMCADDPPARAIVSVVEQFHQLADFVKGYGQ